MNKLISVFILFTLHSCQFIPEIAKNVEDIATDTAIRIEISRETFQKETDLEVNVNVKNKDEQVKK
jgi:hypothetical protein